MTKLVLPVGSSVLQRLNRTLCPQGRVFRGWWVVGSGGLANFFGAILFMQAFGAYVLLVEDEFGWSKAALAGAFALARLESGLLGPLPVSSTHFRAHETRHDLVCRLLL